MSPPIAHSASHTRTTLATRRHSATETATEQQNRLRRNAVGGIRRHSRSIHAQRLQTHHLGVPAATCQQVGVAAGFNDLAGIQDENAIGIANGTEAVGYDNSGSSGGGLVKGALDDLLRGCVQGGGRLI
ncbi:hypothetical protein N7488_007651 [Penicillium malachiteum]|nr:hypothetical protein N7488_007651 [Penicillium malachiteum]